MTRGPMERPPGTRTDRATRPSATAAAITPRPGAPARTGLAALAIGLVALLVLAGAAAAAEQVEGQTVREIRIVGNSTVKTEDIRAKIFSRKDRPLSRDRADADTEALRQTKLFDDVGYEVTHAPDGKGVILTFKVAEMPVLTKVEFIGLSKGPFARSGRKPSRRRRA